MRDAALTWEEELASTLSDLRLTRGIACPCVWQGCIKGEHIVAIVHREKYVIKKQVTGEDAGVEED